MSRQRSQPHILRRVSALTLALLLVVVLLPVRSAALSGATGALTWDLTGGTLTVSGSGPMPDYSDNNMPPWYDSAAAVNRIVVENGVTTVGALAFYGCENAQTVSLPDGVTEIGDRAFKNCRTMTWVNLPEGLTRIGEAAFESCESLNGIVLPESLRTLGNYAFDRCAALTSVTVPAGVENPGLVVFSYCTALLQATVLCPITELPDWYFYGCTSLNTVILPETVRSIGNSAFHDCENLYLVYCAPEAVDAVADALHSDETTESANAVERSDITPPVSNTVYDDETDTAITTTVTRTDSSLITDRTKTKYTYSVGGIACSRSELMAELEKDPELPFEVEEEEKDTVISATVTDEAGWDEVVDTATDTVKHRDEDEPVRVEVQLTGSTVSGDALADMAGSNIELTVTTADGTAWVIDQKNRKALDFAGKTFDLACTVEWLGKNTDIIETETLYRVTFADTIEFDAIVAVLLRMSDAKQVATLYVQDRLVVSPLATVRVDENGRAWFPIGGVSKNKTYYIAINAAGIDPDDAIIPDSLLDEYGVKDVDYVETLLDASGNQYSVGERTSNWGITGKQFAIYAAVALGAVVLIVSGVMITLNRIKRSRMKYAGMAKKPETDIDEDELRMQIMRELLEESEGKKTDERTPHRPAKKESGHEKDL